MLAEQISRVEAEELGGQEFQLAVLSALLQVILAILLLIPVLAILYIISCLEGSVQVIRAMPERKRFFSVEAFRYS